MAFDLPEEQRAFQATARQFARDEMMPHARDWDEGEVFPVEALRKAAALGFGIPSRIDQRAPELRRHDLDRVASWGETVARQHLAPVIDGGRRRRAGERHAERLGGVSQLAIHGPADAESRGGLVSFEIKGVHPHDISELCGRQAVCIRAGHHCAQPVMQRFHVPATSRASFAFYNSMTEVDALVAGIRIVQKVFA